MVKAEFALSDDQAHAFGNIDDLLRNAGVDLAKCRILPRKRTGGLGVAVVLGKAGSGKTHLLNRLWQMLIKAGIHTISSEFDERSLKGKRTVAILAPTHKAASVLRLQGVPATTIHRILYSPLYSEEYTRISEWLSGKGKRPTIKGLTDEALDRATSFFETNPSLPGALAAAGVQSADFIVGWNRRDTPLDIGLVDEASMLDEDFLTDLKYIFPNLILFGDPAQLAPVSQSGQMVFEKIDHERIFTIHRIHRQSQDNPILDLAHALADPNLDYGQFEALIAEKARHDERVVWGSRVDVDLMAHAPVLVWRNATRIRLLRAFRSVHDAPETQLLKGEPLICDGIDLPHKFVSKRLEFEANGLIKGAQVIYMGPGRFAGHARLHILGAEQPQISVESIVRIERPEGEEPNIPIAAKMGALFLHGSSVTIHKSQGSQWDTVQIFGPDIRAAAYSELEESGQPLWKRLAYVAITRAQNRMIWVVRNRLSKPTKPLTIDHVLKVPSSPLELHGE